MRLLCLLCLLPWVAQAQSDRAAELVRVGRAYLSSGDRGSAIGYFREALQADPRAGAAYASLGEAYRGRGSLEDAREVLEAGLIHAPDHAPIYLELSRTLVELHRSVDAATVLRELCYRDRHNVEGLTALIELARERGAWSEALAAERRLSAVPDLDPARLAEARRFASALAILALPLDPVTAPRACSGSSVRRALAHCAPPR